jgi:PAS fold
MGFEGKSEIGIFDINFETGERTWSYELRNLFDIPPEAPPDFLSILQRVHPDDRRAFNAIAVEPFQPDCPARKICQFRIVRADGTVHWLQFVRLTLFRENAAHDAVRIIGYVVEISESAGYRSPWQDAAIAA